MTNQPNKVLVERFAAAINDRKLNDLVELLADDFCYRPSGAPRDGFKKIVEHYISAFPDLHYTVEEMVAEDNTVVVRMTTRGTHQAPYFGRPPTGKSFSVDEVGFAHIADGKIAGYRTVWDEAGFARQLGFT